MKTGFEGLCKLCANSTGVDKIKRAENCLKKECAGDIDAWLALKAEMKGNDFQSSLNTWVSFSAFTVSALAEILAAWTLLNTNRDIEFIYIVLIVIAALGISLFIVVWFIWIIISKRKVREWGYYIQVLLESEEKKKKILG